MDGLTRQRLWFGGALLIPLYFSLMSVGFAFSHPYAVQDDIRQHVVWMQQFVNPDLFPKDLITDYFQSLSPTIFAWLYQAAAFVGIEPLTFAKLLPIPLGLIASAYYFGVCLELFPVPVGAFISTLIFNQTIWIKGDVISATPRALLYPLFAAFLYYLLRQKLWPCLIVIALSFCYPTFALIEVAMLTVRLVEGWPGRPRLSQQRRRYLFWGAGLVVAIAFILPRLLHHSDFGPLVTAADMHTMPEFQAGGRTRYFGVPAFDFWAGGRSGLHVPYYPPVLLLGLALPWVRRTQLPLVQHIKAKVNLLWDILLASLGLYTLAHLLLLTLYFPSRYTGHSFRFILCLASGIVVTVWLQAVWQWGQRLWQQQRWPKLRQMVGLVPVGVFAIASLVVPTLPSIFIPAHGWVIGEHPQLYTYLAQQPQETLIASLSEEANNLPAFAQRSTLVGREFAIPFHLGYYHQLRQRTLDLLNAQYDSNPQTLRTFLETYGVDQLLLDQNAFTPEYLSGNRWLRQYQPTATLAKHLEQGNIPALKSFMEPCAELTTGTHVLLSAPCLLEQTAP